jgi:hypothetical protein
MLQQIVGRRLKDYPQTTNKCFLLQSVTLNKMFCVKHKKDYPSRLAQLKSSLIRKLYEVIFLARLHAKRPNAPYCEKGAGLRSDSSPRREIKE